MVRHATSWWADSCTMCFRPRPKPRPIRPEWSEHISLSCLVHRVFWGTVLQGFSHLDKLVAITGVAQP
jgi:hypothetical protein